MIAEKLIPTDTDTMKPISYVNDLIGHYQDDNYIRPVLEDELRSIQEYLSLNPKEDYYSVIFDRPEDALELAFLHKLTGEEIRTVEDWDETDGDLKYDALCDSLLGRTSFPVEDADNPWRVSRIDLDPVHSILFTMAFPSLDEGGKTTTERQCVALNQDEYTALFLWKVVSEMAGVLSNRLYSLPLLRDRIESDLEWAHNDGLFYEPLPPHALLMTELDEDVRKYKEWKNNK